jgi:hypothetical protein
MSVRRHGRLAWASSSPTHAEERSRTVASLSSEVSRRAIAAALAALGSLSVLSGCGIGPDSTGAVSTAEAFARQTSAAPDQACALLSRQTREDLEKSQRATCAEALPAVGLPALSDRRSVDVYEQHARVVLADDVLFLARFADGWRVTAAGCVAQPGDTPYKCELGG